MQENGPERLPFKQELWGRFETVAPRALLLSSSSSLTASQQAALMKHPERLLVGHPFNPPHLIPLVEVVPGEKTDAKAVEDAVAFYWLSAKSRRSSIRRLEASLRIGFRGRSSVNVFIS